MRALLSVWDKRGLVALARGLEGLGVELVASGGTAKALEEADVAHLEVAALTGSPEMLSGRVKTLHPKLHGGILANLDDPAHVADLAAQGIVPIDLVVCNLYPFRSDPSIELIDVGGPTMVRAAAKNHAHVGVVVDPDDYAGVLAELRAHGALGAATRARLARKAFAHTAAYDAAIVTWFDAEVAATDELPETLHVTLERAEALRYGENPHQRGARYRLEGTSSFWEGVEQHGGVALSYLNLFDADAAWRLAHELAHDAGGEAAVLVKHANACGAAVAPTLVEAFSQGPRGGRAERVRRHLRPHGRDRRARRRGHRTRSAGRRRHRRGAHRRGPRAARRAPQGDAAPHRRRAGSRDALAADDRRHGARPGPRRVRAGAGELGARRPRGRLPRPSVTTWSSPGGCAHGPPPTRSCWRTTSRPSASAPASSRGSPPPSSPSRGPAIARRGRRRRPTRSSRSPTASRCSPRRA